MQAGWLETFELLLLPRAAPPTRAAPLGARFGALRAAVRARRRARGLAPPPHGLPPCLLSFSAGPLLQARRGLGLRRRPLVAGLVAGLVAMRTS